MMCARWSHIKPLVKSSAAVMERVQQLPKTAAGEVVSALSSNQVPINIELAQGIPAPDLKGPLDDLIKTVNRIEKTVAENKKVTTFAEVSPPEHISLQIL